MMDSNITINIKITTITTTDINKYNKYMNSHKIVNRTCINCNFNADMNNIKSTTEEYEQE